MTDATTRALAELRRRREQHRIAAAHYRGEEPAGNTTERKAETHDHIARGLSTAIDVLQETSSDVTTAPTAADDRVLSIVEVPESGTAHRRRRYTPARDGDADAHLETARFEADGWRVTGEGRLAQLAVDGERIFADD
jgi:hypothetical protein